MTSNPRLLPAIAAILIGGTSLSAITPILGLAILAVILLGVCWTLARAADRTA